MMTMTTPGTRAAFAVAGIGVVGELVVLRHLLVDCYPFKMLTYPPWQFYAQLGNYGSVAVFGVMTLVAVVIARRAPLLVPPVTTAVAPLLYLTVVAVATLVLYGWAVPAGTRNFDGYTIGKATAEFASIATELAAAGLILGGICSAVLQTVTRRNAPSSAT